MLKRTFIMCLASLMLALPVLAHPGHGSTIDQGQAIERGHEEITRLVGAQKLDKAWQMSVPIGVSLGGPDDSKEWIVTFSLPDGNTAEAGEATLYVFLAENGDYLAANFTGK